MEQHQGITQQLPGIFGHQQLRMGAADHPLETAGRQPVCGETVLFQGHQCWQVIQGCNAKEKSHITAVKVA